MFYYLNEFIRKLGVFVNKYIKPLVFSLSFLTLVACAESNVPTTTASHASGEEVEGIYNPDTAIGKKKELFTKSEKDLFSKLNDMTPKERKKFLAEHKKSTGFLSSSPSDNVLRVNVWLWRAVLDSLQIMPLDKILPESGVITTKWYDMSGYGTVQINVYILGSPLKAESLRVVVFKKNKGVIKPDKLASAQLNDVILLRARQLKKYYVDTH